ncbi:MAG: tetratricopeptide repeat protein [Streptosporangiales bacterium]|nr:tetratricopeptide repeat protein [Streptosporangiales bacterium]
MLGPLEARVGGRIVAVPGRATRMLLSGLLLTPNEPVGEQWLAEFVWGPSGATRGALQTSVSRLRSWLRDGLGLREAVDYAAGRYRLDVPVESVDVNRFRTMVRLAGHDTEPSARIGHLQGALDEWRGPVLDGSPDWIRSDPLVVELERLRTDGACALAEAALQASRPTLALPHLERLAAALPYDEPLHARLMALLGASGRRADALRLFEEIRRRLAEELGVDPSDALREAHVALLRSDGEPRPAAASGGRTKPPPVPAEVPPDVAAFTGRVGELDRLRELLTGGDAGTVAISAVDGAGGIGKSALAIHAAHQLAEEFPDGQLYVNLQGAAAGTLPLEPGDVLARWLRALGDTTQVTDPEEAAARFRSVVAARRMLVILDNAVDAAQIRPLLPATPTCAVLVTSRRVLAALDGATHLHLDALSSEEAETLLARIVGARRVIAEPEAAARIARLCGYLPLALRIAAARLVARPEWPLAALADRLADEHRRLDELSLADLEVRATFQIGYRDLDSSPSGRGAARMFRLVGLLDGPDIGVEVAAALADLSAAQAEAALEHLVDAQLLESPTPNRYQMHDLVRLFARERAHDDEPEAERVAAVRRALDCYLAAAKQAMLVIDPSNTLRRDRIHIRPAGDMRTHADAAAWTDAERANLLSAAQQAETLPGASGVAVQVAVALNRPFEARGYWRELITLNRLAIKCAERSGDRRGEALARSDLGSAYGKLGHLDDQILHLERALAICVESGDRDLKGHVLNYLGIAYRRQGHLDKAIDRFEQALAIHRERNKRDSEARVLNNLGNLNQELGRADVAIVHHQRSLALHREFGNPRGEGNALGSLAGAHLLAGCGPEASAHYRQALTISREVGERYLEAEQLWGLGLTLYGLLDRPEEARRCWRESLAILQELGGITAEEADTLLTSPAPETPEVIRRNSPIPSLSDLAPPARAQRSVSGPGDPRRGVSP